MSVCLCQSIYLSIYLSICLSISLYIPISFPHWPYITLSHLCNFYLSSSLSCLPLSIYPLSHLPLPFVLSSRNQESLGVYWLSWNCIFPICKWSRNSHAFFLCVFCSSYFWMSIWLSGGLRMCAVTLDCTRERAHTQRPANERLFL